MKKTYTRPGLVEFGTLNELTLGSGGSLPDYDQNFNLINSACPTSTFGGSTRTACINAIS